MASICKFFDEDAVYKINKKKFIDVGLVLENSEYLSSDDEQSDDPDYKDWGERMKKGHIRVAWHPNGAEEVLPEKKVKLCDRSLMPGDVVRKIVKGKDTQLGYCRYTVVKADVQVVGTKQVLVGIDSRELHPLEEFVADVAVFKDSWVGMVKTVKTELTLRCNDGSRCLMSDVDAFDMEDILDRRERASEFKKYSFYPGQQLWGPTFCFQKVKWLTLNKPLADLLNSPNKSVRAYVEDVKVVALGVQWVCKAYSEENFRNQATEQPKYHVTGDDLKSVKMMNIFEPCTLQIGDRNYLVMKDEYECISLREWRNRIASRLNADNSPLSKPKAAKGTESRKNTAVEECNENCNEKEESQNNTKDISDIDDGDEDDSMKSSDASSVTSRSTASSIETAAIFYVGVTKKKKGPHYATKMKRKMKSVRRRAMRHVMKEALPLKHNSKLVTETLVTETKAHVVWQDGTVEYDILSTSLYPVHHLDSHEFFPGDYVVDSKESRPYEYGVVKRVDHSGRTALVTWMKTYHAGASPHPEVLNEQEVSVYDIKDHPDFKYRPGACVIRVVNAEDSNPGSTAGQVVDVHCSGQVEVSWVNGDTSLCYPQELYRVGEYDSDDLWADDESVSDEDSWETESEKSLVGLEDGITEKDIDGATRDLEKISIKFDDKDDEKSTEDMQEKLLANIEKLRAGMARLEEVFTQNPTLQTCNVMRRLLELYKHCKVLDQLLGTTYFHERHLQSLVERLKHRGRVNSIQHMADQIFRLFSSNDANSDANEAKEDVADSEKTLVNDSSKIDIDILIDSSKAEDSSEIENANINDSSKVDIDIFIESPIKESPPLLTNHCNEDGTNRKPLLSPVSPTSSEPRNLCQQLCAILKSRLLKAHEDAEQRFGMPRSETSALLAAELEQVTPAVEKTEESEIPPNDKNTQTTEQTVPEEKPPPSIVLDDEAPEINSGQGVFSILESVPDSHKYKLSIFQPAEPSAFFRIVRKEMHLLISSLPEGTIVKSFEDRIDLYSVLIKGPRRTPYEDGLFFFDFQLPADYPKVPPLCHYISYCSDRLNPNLYEGGKVCVSLLGTWGGKGTEMWNPSTSNLLQVIVSIQGLILVSEPYYNEAGYERQKGTQLGMENSRMYNEMVVLKLVQSMTKLIVSPPEVFRQEIIEHFQNQSSKFIQRLEKWLEISESYNAEHPLSPTSPTTFKEIHSKNYDSSAQDVPLPEFPLIPASKGFCLTLRKSLADFKNILSTSLPPPTNS
ncbi:(E3-independent) E2 ubiquitin-conjugating enzyme UBE2O-like isoform X2 [Argiope bruennichi]|uniref:(E3-independent) E2 ubiquitin-conjugating enzyme UBE2O-like isoform X2 n=1 Tax=Argiope bruennichi TaxID=94029 RepID=UPI00249504A2|nr:(E3-independent) E2 ubiquitin-conjugating enzyme UBE2O-like isoform X2 [Argiope bruennichi]